MSHFYTWNMDLIELSTNNRGRQLVICQKHTHNCKLETNVKFFWRCGIIYKTEGKCRLQIIGKKLVVVLKSLWAHNHLAQSENAEK